MFVSEYDKSMINEILSKQDVYHITSLPWEVASRDCGPGQMQNKATLRNRWMYDNTGFFKSLDDYSNTFKRIDEYLERCDSPFTLRQRINIVNELFDCDFDTNLPLHVSIKPYAKALIKERKHNEFIPDWIDDDSYDNTTLNLNDDSINNYSFIVHPGQTRAQASVFTRTNLKNTLLYVNKKHNVNVIMNSSKYITKIESLEQLIKAYRTNENVADGNNLTIGFSTPDVVGDDYDGGFKTHKQHGITIFKAFHIHDYNLLTTGIKKSYHASANYTYKSLKSINNFYKLLSNNRFILYTSNLAKSSNKNKLNQTNLYYKKNNKTADCDLDYQENKSDSYESYQNLVFNNLQISPRLWEKLFPNVETLFSDTEIKLLKEYQLFLSKNKELLKEIFENSKTFIFEPHVEKVDFDIKNLGTVHMWKELVIKNEYTGICIYMHDSVIQINDRDIHEFLFCINTEVSMTRSKDSKVSIINCEHEYWKTGKNYKEWILPKSFYTP